MSTTLEATHLNRAFLLCAGVVWCSVLCCVVVFRPKSYEEAMHTLYYTILKYFTTILGTPGVLINY